MKKLIIIVVIIVTIASGILYLLINRDNTSSPSTIDTSGATRLDATPSDEFIDDTRSSYIEYSEKAFVDTSGTRLLFFHAEWCPQCLALERSIMESAIPEDVTIFEVNYDQRQDLRQKYGVTLQTTVVAVDKNGQLANKYVAYDTTTWQALQSNLL